MRYKLLAPHYIDDQVLEAGTEIGDGTSFPFRDSTGAYRLPTDQMEPLDSDAIAALKAYQASVPAPDSNSPIVDAVTGATLSGPKAKQATL